MIAKCANPACRTRFDHHLGGKFFRFCLTEAEISIIPDATQNPHNVIHYWLCPICSKMFSLVHVEAGKVVLRVVEQQLEIATAQAQPTAA